MCTLADLRICPICRKLQCTAYSNTFFLSELALRYWAIRATATVGSVGQPSLPLALVNLSCPWSCHSFTTGPLLINTDYCRPTTPPQKMQFWRCSDQVMQPSQFGPHQILSKSLHFPFFTASYISALKIKCSLALSVVIICLITWLHRCTANGPPFCTSII